MLAFAGIVFVAGGVLILTMGRYGDRSEPSFQQILFAVGVGLLVLSSARGLGVALAAMRAGRSSAGALAWALATLAVVLYLLSLTAIPTTGASMSLAGSAISPEQVLASAAIASAVAGILVALAGATRALRHR